MEGLENFEISQAWLKAKYSASELQALILKKGAMPLILLCLERIRVYCLALPPAIAIVAVFTVRVVRAIVLVAIPLIIPYEIFMSSTFFLLDFFGVLM